MSGERMTSIRLLGHLGSGVAEWGRKTVPEMAFLVREYAKHKKAEAEAILAADSDAFRVETYTGVHVHRNRETLQEGRRVEFDAEAALPLDLVELVIAARIVAFEDQSPAALHRLDKASEAFASRVPWEGETTNDEAAA